MEQDLLSKLSNIIDSIPFLLSEIGIAALLIGIVIVDLFPFKRNKNVLYIFTVLALVGDIIYLSFITEATVNKLMLFTLVQDEWSIKFRILSDVCAIFFFIHLYFNQIEKKSNSKLSGEGEWVSLGLGILLGAHVLTMANDFIVAILALELMSLPAYLLTAFKGDKLSIEAAIKYFLYGAIATAITIYGVSLLYGMTTAIDLQGIELYEQDYSILYTVSIILIIMGFLFKLGSFPMHIWVPDVYQAAPIEAVAYFSTLPKIGATVFLYRFFNEIHITEHPYLSYFLLLIGVMSMFVGNLSALYQTSLRRLMGYSSIANAGLIIFALLNKDDISANALFYFLWVYVIANYVLFYFIGEIERVKKSDNLKVLEGIGWESSAVLWGPAIVIAVISLIGLPPVAGFIAKILIFTSLWELYNINTDIYYLLAIVFGLLNTVISLAYYLKIPFYIYQRNSKSLITLNVVLSRVIVILGISLVLLFIVPSLIL